MKNRMILSVLLIFLLTACLQQTRTGVTSSVVEYLYPNGEAINHQADQLPHLQLPLKVGIAFVPEQGFYHQATLSAVEQDKLLRKVQRSFSKYPFIEKIEVIPALYLKQGKGFTTLSQVANMFDIDVIALVGYDHVQQSEENVLSLAYWTVVGAYVIPGETAGIQTFVDTAVFDIATRKLLFRAPGMATEKVATTMVGKERHLDRVKLKTFNQAVEQMTNNLDVSLSTFKDRVKNEKIATVSYREGYGGGSASFFGILTLVLLVRFTKRSKIR